MILTSIMAMTKHCLVEGCKHPKTHVTKGHCCGTCDHFGHGQLECNKPQHKVVLAQYNRALFGIVTLFGLFYFLVVLTRMTSVIGYWDEYIICNPQTKEEAEPILRGTGFPKIPKSAFDSGDSVYANAARYAEEKFRESLDRYAIKIMIGKRME